ncbi:S49 family peptidase [Telluribacter humicola]|uniref:S49 family peptidase n=1 Tax=Telluribacter humicola TaxID=1720261 RepID=UPI001A9605B6|nr:S49 family peptidase [Telluribacter humicola]
MNLLEGKPWPAELATRAKTLRVKAWDDDDDNEPDEDPWLPMDIVENVAIVGISGPMTKYGGLCSYGTLDYIKAIETAYNDDRVEAVLLKVDSPGGEVRSIADLYDLVKLNHKPVVAFVEDMAASAALYGIIGAQHIQAAQATNEVGSIGVYTTFRNYSKYLEKAGISQKSIYSRLSTEKNIEIREALDGKTELLEDHLDVLATAFIDAVKAARGSKINLEVADPFKGKSFFAKDALAIGLIDEIGPLSVAFERAQALAAGRKVKPTAGSTTQPFSHSNNQSQTDMFGNKFTKLSALAGLATAMITDTQIEEANAQLAERGIEGLTLVRNADLEVAAGLESQLNQVKGQVDSLTKERDDAQAEAAKVTDLQAQVQKLTEERDAAQAEAAKYGKQPDGEPAKPVKKAETIEGSQGENPFLSQTDIELAALKQKAQLN